MQKIPLLFLLSLFACTGNRTKNCAEIQNTGTVKAYIQAETSHKIINCEASGVLFFNDSVYVVSDKPAENFSPVFSLHLKNLKNGENINYLRDPLLVNTQKLEDMSITHDKKFMLATASFDRVKTDATWDIFNSVLYWKTTENRQVKVLSPSFHENIESSLILREKIIKALDNKDIAYFKVEGIAALPNNRLLFGIRESGESYKKFDYRITILEVGYYVENDSIKLSDNLTLKYDYKPDSSLQIERPLGLSSIEYDSFNNRLLILTSYELFDSIDSKAGAYLWTIDLQCFDKNEDLQIVGTKNGEILHFPRKAEGISMIDSNSAIIIFDDDRETEKFNTYDKQFSQKRENQDFFYAIINFY